MQSQSALYHRRTMKMDDICNSWVEPSEYPRIPNVYEPVEDGQLADFYENREKNEVVERDMSTRDSHKSSWAMHSIHASGEQAHKELANDPTNYSVVVQLGSSYRSDNLTPGAGLRDSTKDWRSSTHRPDSAEKRRARREASLEEWKDAGDRLFCQSGRYRP
ncbi:hypothetical protein SNK03_009743 [Fusarium graminearum]|uniref:Chromosome 4, complete genome n=4 Tax=Fusarium sambucinum species complex TaxID=569360 RepID=A0A1C3YLJ6_GIBZE|nr:hypothetical protein FG05_09609 [Fusarium graminearum]KAF5247465.1 hypothetical protein FAUST_702 [Fusarium austroamericanum]KAI6769167.1 hypothetical protein HG531_010271 [Fusarium graminearum]PCD17837.1 hypothetical protein FGRA07_07305 [Fusarium graminearum]CAF3536971.1 unnamed protein product [Fusarium graminearum]